ncbi:hypothetical protein [Nocardia rhamnosiphila]|uniref:Uncharacterized protein n=1 Tax=Nocardia rhamnosiphila TaxID=426716 RepID=A0ABV2X1U8_9NOCA
MRELRAGNRTIYLIYRGHAVHFPHRQGETLAVPARGGGQVPGHLVGTTYRQPGGSRGATAVGN